MTYNQLLQEGKTKLTEAGIADGVTDAWLLLSHITGWNRAKFFLSGGTAAEETHRKQFEELIARRARHIPTQHLIGSQEFMGISVKVCEDVLIPRQETELLVEWVLTKAPENATVVDMCTGSGCIAIALKQQRSDLQVVAADLSEKALAVATENAEATGTEVELIQSDLFASVSGKFDCIVSNPPYITGQDMKLLAPEVGEHEPTMALYGGEDGLDFYRRIIIEAKEHLNHNGQLFFEIGYDQGESVPALLRAAGYVDVECRKDYAGLDRMVYARYCLEG